MACFLQNWELVAGNLYVVQICVTYMCRTKTRHCGRAQIVIPYPSSKFSAEACNEFFVSVQIQGAQFNALLRNRVICVYLDFYQDKSVASHGLKKMLGDEQHQK